jgi:hypothetical protein
LRGHGEDSCGRGGMALKKGRREDAGYGKYGSYVSGGGGGKIAKLGFAEWLDSFMVALAAGGRTGKLSGPESIRRHRSCDPGMT